jgi:hypothetical protein
LNKAPEEPLEQPAPAGRPNTPLWVLGVSIVLLVLVSQLGAFDKFAPSTEPPADESRIAAAFPGFAAPMNWELDHTFKLPDGIEGYVYKDPNAAEPAALPEDPPTPKQPESEPSSSGSGGGHGGRGGHGPKDKELWSRLALGAENQPPRQVVLMYLPAKVAEEQLRKWFIELKYKDLERVSEKGESIPIDSGGFNWSGYWASFVRVRHLRQVDKKPTFHESIRVNLTVGQQAWVAVLTWDERLPANESWAESAIDGFAPQAAGSAQ